jgi:flagellar basal-body rod protein FlgC
VDDGLSHCAAHQRLGAVGRTHARQPRIVQPEGFVTFPNVNPVHEVVNLMSASRSYEANATAIETLKTMAQRGLDIAR